MIRACLRAYAPAVVREWWADVGMAAGIIGYLVNLFADLKVPVGVWVAIFVMGLALAQFRAFQRLWLQSALQNRQQQLPQWAMWACNANSDGAWLTAMVVGDPPKRPLTSADYPELISAVERHFKLRHEECEVEAYAELLRIRVPKTDLDNTPIFQVQLGVQTNGTICIQCRTQDEPLSLVWIIDHLNSMLAFTLSATSELVVRRKGRTYRLCLGNWPANGIATDGLVEATRLSQNYSRGSRTIKDYVLKEHDTDCWGPIRHFTGLVLADAGYSVPEASLGALALPYISPSRRREVEQVRQKQG